MPQRYKPKSEIRKALIFALAKFFQFSSSKIWRKKYNSCIFKVNVTFVKFLFMFINSFSLSNYFLGIRHNNDIQKKIFPWRLYCKKARKLDSEFKNLTAWKTFLVWCILVFLKQTKKIPTNSLTVPFLNTSSLSFCSRYNSPLIFTKAERETEVHEACYCICSQIYENQIFTFSCTNWL